MPPHKKSSEIWNHFTVAGDNKKAKCSYCFQYISFSNGALGNLGRHLKRKHTSVTFAREHTSVTQVRSVPVVSETPLPIANTAKGVQPVSETSEITSQGTVAVAPSTSNLTTSNRLVRQGNVTDFINVTKPMSVSKSKQIDHQLVVMMVKEYQPFRLVEDKEFRKLLFLLNPAYAPPTRKTISNSLIPQLYKTVSEEARLKLSHAEAVCLTTDGWTSLNNESFVAVTAHFFNEKFQLCSLLLGCTEFTDRHTADNISEHLLQVAQQWGIHNKITAIVTDNASNMVAAVKQCNWRHVQCFAHSLNLVAQAGIGKIQNIVDKIKSIVAFFKRSSQALFKLHTMQDQLGLPRLKLLQDVSTRWNSTYEMVDRFISVKDALVSTLAILDTGLEPLSSHDWKVISQARNILQIFKEVTDEISAEKYVSLSKVILFVNAIMSDLDTSVGQKDAMPEIREMLTVLRENMDKRFKSIEDNELYTQANLLDPRFKKYSFGNESKYKTACESLRKKAASTIISRSSNTPEDDQTSNEFNNPCSIPNLEDGGPAKKKTKLYDRFDDTVKKNSEGTNKLAAGIVEVNKYLDEDLADRNEDPLSWWKARENLYPRLYSLVNKRLCIQATSVACERLFSKAGQIQNEKRSRLKSAKVSQILFLNHNL